MPLLLVIGTLAAIVMGRCLREKKNQDNREDDGRSGSKDPEGEGVGRLVNASEGSATRER